MAYTYEELKHKTVADLREIAKGIEHEAVQGYSQLNKEHLLVALRKALGLDAHVHHHAVGIDKAAIKTKINELKKKGELLASKSRDGLGPILRNIHALKGTIRRATV
jgi:hypothetical protein